MIKHYLQNLQNMFSPRQYIYHSLKKIYMKKSKKILFTYSLLLILLSTLPTLNLAKAQDSSEKTYKALFLVSNGYGDNYYDLVGNFSQWGWTIETAGICAFIDDCTGVYPGRVEFYPDNTQGHTSDKYIALCRKHYNRMNKPKVIITGHIYSR